MTDSTIIQICSSSVLALVTLHAMHVKLSKITLEKWETNNGFEVIDSQYRHFFKGPFFMRGFKGQTVYYLRFRDNNGRLRSGWIRFRGSYLKMFPDRPDERWDADKWPNQSADPKSSSVTPPANAGGTPSGSADH
jgi:hypothetical protein